MRHLRVAILCWIVTAAGAALGSLAGTPFGRQGLFLAATIVGTLAVLLAIRAVTTLGWLDVERRKGGSIGGLVGFALGAPLGLMHLDAPLIALAALALVGVGVLVGAGPNAVR